MPLSSITEGNPRSSFGLRTAPVDAALLGMFALIDNISDTDAQITLSGMARARLRELFPQGEQAKGIVELTNGLRVEVDLEDSFGAEFYVGHCNEALFLDALVEAIDDKAVVVDVGANFGLYALHTAFLGCRTIAFEAAPGPAECLRANIQRNGLEGFLTLSERAVCEAVGKADFYLAKDASFSGLRDTGRSEAASRFTVETTDLDSALTAFEASEIDFLKIDVEGAEWRVLDGAWKTIELSKNLVIMMEYSFKNIAEADVARTKACIDKLCASGLVLYGLGGLPTVVHVFKAADEIPSDFNGSLLAVRPGSKFGEKLLEGLTARIEDHKKEPPLAALAITPVLHALKSANEDRAHWRRSAEKLSDALGDLETKLNHSQARASELQDSAAQFKAIALKEQQKFSESQACVAEQEKTIAALKATISAAENQTKDEGMKTTELPKTISELTALLARLEQRLDETGDRSKDLDSAIDEIRDAVSVRDGAINALNERVQSLDSSVASLELQTETHRSTLRVIKQETAREKLR